MCSCMTFSCLSNRSYSSRNATYSSRDAAACSSNFFSSRSRRFSVVSSISGESEESVARASVCSTLCGPSGGGGWAACCSSHDFFSSLSRLQEMHMYVSTLALVFRVGLMRYQAHHYKPNSTSKAFQGWLCRIVRMRVRIPWTFFPQRLQ